MAVQACVAPCCVWIAVLAFLGLPALQARAELAKNEQACVKTLNAKLRKLAATGDKAASACVRDYGSGDEPDVEECLAADRFGAIAKATSILQERFADACSGDSLPGSLATDLATIVDAAARRRWRTLAAVFGPDVAAAVLTKAADEDGARCQAAVTKGVVKCADVQIRESIACVKNALKAGKDPFPGGATTPAELQACVLADAKGKIAKACDTNTTSPAGKPRLDKLRAALAKKCTAAGVALIDAFPQCASSDADAVHACVYSALRCSSCLTLNAADGLDADCDVLDDGAANQSCLRPLDLLLPAYANPCCGDGPAMWSTLAATAATKDFAVHVILNPASGPGASPIDPNYINDLGGGPSGPLLDVRAAGARMYGYVSTSFATRDMALVKADVDTYYDPAFWRGAGVQVDGIFFDEMSSDLPNVGYYEELRDYVRAKSATARVLANPGIAQTQDSSAGASGFTVADYARAADTLVTFENTGLEYRTNYTPPLWLDELSPLHFAHLAHGEAATADMQSDIALARSRKAGMVYVTDDVLVPNPWDSLASYFTAELLELAP